MKPKYTKPQVTKTLVSIECSIANSSRDCNGRNKGKGHGDGRGCKEWDEGIDLHFDEDNIIF